MENQLFALWFIVLISMIGVGLLFWLGEHYNEVIGNFWVLLGLIVGSLVAYRFIGWTWGKLKNGA